MKILVPGIALLFLVGCASTSTNAREEVTDPGSTVEARRAEAIASGKELWGRCQSCHGRDGRAQTAFGASHDIPDLTTKEWRRAQKSEELMASITEGCGPDTVGGKPRMPAAQDLSEDEIRSLIAYIFSLGS